MRLVLCTKQCPVLLRTKKYYSSTTLYYEVLLRTTKYMILMMNPRHMWNVINTEWSKRYQPPCPCHAKRISWLIRITYETSCTMRGARGVTLQPHQILRWETPTSPTVLRLARKTMLQNFRKIFLTQVKRHLQCGDDPTMIRPWSENVYKPWVRNPPRTRGYQEHFVKYNISRSGYHS